MTDRSPQPVNVLNLDRLLNQRLHGTPWQAFWQEFVGNSGHFLILKLLSDITEYGWYAFFNDVTDWSLVGAFALQTWCLTQRKFHHFWGNLVGPCIYTLVDLPVDGWGFFEEPSHWMLWGFCSLIAVFQGLRLEWQPAFSNYLLPLESIVRTVMVWTAYLITTAALNQEPVTLSYIQAFFARTSHEFLFLALVFLGALLGVQSLQIAQQQRQTQETAEILRHLAQWGMGDHVVTSAIMNPAALTFQRVKRAIVFMDIRGFTAWCEASRPERVAQVLNHYYQVVEPVATAHGPLRVTFTADEVMVIYPNLPEALRAAVAMQRAARSVLAVEGLGAGCGLHYGPVVEGLFGSEGVRTYTAIGDTVNTAKRIEGATPANQIYLSDTAYQRLPIDLQAGCQALPSIQAKGKSYPVDLWCWAAAI
jgi:class 3 adenylate cyclase